MSMNKLHTTLKFLGAPSRWILWAPAILAARTVLRHCPIAAEYIEHACRYYPHEDPPLIWQYWGDHVVPPSYHYIASEGSSFKVRSAFEAHFVVWLGWSRYGLKLDFGFNIRPYFCHYERSSWLPEYGVWLFKVSKVIRE